MIILTKPTALVLILSLLASVGFTFSAQQMFAQRVQVLMPDGRPAVAANVRIRNATRFRFRDSTKAEITETRLRTDKEGWVALPEDQDLWMGLVIVDVPGTALGLWNHMEKSNKLQLIEPFSVHGLAKTTSGQAVENAKVKVVQFGVFTYSPVFFHLLNDIEGFQTTTNSEGQFRLRGATLNDYQFAAGAKVWIRGDLNNRNLTGVQAFPFTGDSKRFVKETLRLKPAAPVIMHPISQISGKIIDGLTGKPVVGAEITPDHVSYIEGRPVKTDQSGAFVLKDVPTYRKRSFRIDHESLAKQVRVMERVAADPRNPSTTDMVVQVWPKLKFSAQVVEAEKAKVPCTPLTVSFDQTQEPLSGWESTSKGSVGNIGPAAMCDSEGRFSLDIPSGPLRLRAYSSFPNRRKPYDHTWSLDNRSNETPPERTLAIPRQVGLLAKIVLTDSRFDNQGFWDNLIVSVGRTGGRSFSYADRHSQWFFPVERWGDQVDVEIEQRMDDGQRVHLLEKTTFTTDSNVWPLEIKIRPREPGK